MSAAPYDERLRLPDRLRRMNAVKWMILAVLISLLTPICLAAEKVETPKPAQSTDELRQQLEKILKDTHTNGVSLAIVHKEGPEWVTGLGSRCGQWARGHGRYAVPHRFDVKGFHVVIDSDAGRTGQADAR